MSRSKATFWDRMSKRYDKNINKHGSGYRKTIEGTTALLSAADVLLDLGCASGEMSLDLAGHVQRVRGIDTSGKMIELANEKAGARTVENVSFHHADAFDQGLAIGSFSAIVAFNVFHLVDDAPRVLARMNDLLADGGLLVSQTPCLSERGWFIRSLIGLAQKLRVAPPIRSFTFAELESLVSNGGFGIVETKMWNAKDAVQWVVARKM